MLLCCRYAEINEPNPAYNGIVRDNPCYMNVDEVMSKEEEYPLFEQWLKEEKGQNVRKLKANFEQQQQSDDDDDDDLNMFSMAPGENLYSLAGEVAATEEQTSSSADSGLGHQQQQQQDDDNGVDPEPLRIKFNSNDNLYEFIQ